MSNAVAVTEAALLIASLGNVCRHDSEGSHEVTHMKEWIRQLPMTQWHNLFGAWTNEDEALHSGPNSLRLSRIMPLPSALPHPLEPLPSLTAGFSACEALRRLQVSEVAHSFIHAQMKLSTDWLLHAAMNTALQMTCYTSPLIM